MLFSSGLEKLLTKMISKNIQKDYKYLANRQLAPYRYGKGRVLFHDDCEDLLKYRTGGAGVQTISLETTMPFQGNKSIDMYAAGGAVNSCYLTKRLPALLGGYLGIDFFMAIDDGNYDDFNQFTFSLQNHGLSGDFKGEVDLICTGSATGYDISCGTKDMLFKFPVDATNDTKENFHHVKLVIDTNETQFYYMIIDNQFYDLRGVPLAHSASWNANNLFMSMYLHGTAGGADTHIFIDNITITDREKLPKFPEEYETHYEV